MELDAMNVKKIICIDCKDEHDNLHSISKEPEEPGINPVVWVIPVLIVAIFLGKLIESIISNPEVLIIPASFIIGALLLSRYYWLPRVVSE
jgi:hypothetical protein